MILTGLLLFIFYLVFDILYSWYILCLTESKALKSAILSAVLMGMSLFGTVEIIKNIWFALPICTGCFLGTFLTIKLQNVK